MRAIRYINRFEDGAFEQQVECDDTSFWLGNLFYARQYGIVIKVIAKQDMLN